MRSPNLGPTIYIDQSSLHCRPYIAPPIPSFFLSLFLSLSLSHAPTNVEPFAVFVSNFVPTTLTTLTTVCATLMIHMAVSTPEKC